VNTALLFTPTQTTPAGNDIREFLSSICPECNQVDWNAFHAYCMPLMTLYARRAGLRSVDAEDIAANAMMKLFVLISQKRLQTDPRFKGYIAIMIKHEVHDYYRLTKEFYGNGSGMLCCSAKEELQFDSVQYDDDGEVSDLAVRQKLEDLTRAMGIVKKKVAASSWQMFCDVTIEGLSAQEVAEKMGVKTQTVYQRNFQIKRMIRREAGVEQ